MYTMYTRNMPTLWYIRRERTAAFYEEKSQDLNFKKKYVKDIHASLELLIWITCPDNPALEWPSCPYGCLSKSLNSYEADQLSLLLVSLSLSRTSLFVSALEVPGSEISNTCTRIRYCFISTANLLTLDGGEKEIELKCQKTT